MQRNYRFLMSWTLHFWAAQLRFQRRLLWLKREGRMPPDDRNFTPRCDGDERTAADQWERKSGVIALLESEIILALSMRKDDVYPRRPSWSLPARPDDASPGWDNVVRAYEEDR